MHDFLRFARHFVEILHFVRGVLLVLLAALGGCAALLVVVEDQTIGSALYFTLITAMTVGYGDIVPTTAFGRIISVVIAMIGVVYVGLVVAIATRAVAQAVEEKQGEGE
jgi:voltage-gated potassium channel